MTADDAPSKPMVHKIEVYHLVASTGFYYSRCSCGVKSAEAPSGSMAWKWMRQFHPEAFT